MPTKEYKIVTVPDIRGIGSKRIIGSANGNRYTIMELNDAEAKRVLSQGAKLYIGDKRIFMSDFVDSTKPQTIPNVTSCIDDYTNHSKNVLNSECKIFGNPREFHADVVDTKVDIKTVYPVMDLTEVFANIEPGETIRLSEGTYEANITIDKSVHIIGDGAVLTGTVKVSGDGDVIIEGITFANAKSEKGKGGAKTTSKGSLIEVNGNVDFKLTDSKIEGATHFYNSININTTGLVRIRNVFFGNGNSYNGIEMGIKTPIKGGSYICNCYFEKKFCNNNCISLYAFEDKGNFCFDDNHFENSSTAYRISNANNAEAYITIADNSYDYTMPNATGVYLTKGYTNTRWWSGLLFTEAYIKGMDFSKTYITIINCKYNGKVMKNVTDPEDYADQLYYYVYDNPSEEKSYPVITVL